MLEALQTEISSRADLAGASQKIVIRTLNSEDADVETWVVSENDCKIPRGDMLALLSLASQVKLSDWMDVKSTDAAKGFVLFYTAHERFKTSDSTFRATISLLHDPLELITEAERDAILRFGERKKTRAEEIVGHLLTEEDFE